MKRIPAGFLLEGFQIEGMATEMNSLGLGYFNTVFVGPSKVTCLTFVDKGYDSLPSAENVVGPPVKGGLMVNAGGLGIFGSLDRV
jgi:hypothetical protein